MISLINIIIMDSIDPIRIAKLINPIPKPVNSPYLPMKKVKV